MARNDKYKRNKRTPRIENDTILIVCGGKTEKLYFEEFKSDLGNIRIEARENNESPTRIVEYAIKLKQKDTYIQSWVVFDKDEFKDFDSAILLAYKNNIHVAFSNQAFELWFLLHYKYISHNFHRKNYKEELNKLIGKSYQKTDNKMYSILKNKMNTAINNAKRSHQEHKLESTRPSDWESCTTVYLLVSELNKWKK